MIEAVKFLTTVSTIYFPERWKYMFKKTFYMQTTSINCLLTSNQEFQFQIKLWSHARPWVITFYKKLKQRNKKIPEIKKQMNKFLYCWTTSLKNKIKQLSPWFGKKQCTWNKTWYRSSHTSEVIRVWSFPWSSNFSGNLIPFPFTPCAKGTCKACSVSSVK